MSNGPSRELVSYDESLLVSIVPKIKMNGLEWVVDRIMQFEWFLRIVNRPFDTLSAIIVQVGRCRRLCEATTWIVWTCRSFCLCPDEGEPVDQGNVSGETLE